MQQIHRLLREGHPLIQMIQRCLKNRIRERPTIHAVLEFLEQARAEVQDGECDMSKLELVQTLRQKTQLIERREGENRSLSQQLAGKDQVIRSKDDEMRTLSQQLAGKDQVIRSKDDEMRTLSQQLAGKDQVIRSKDDEMRTLSQQLAGKDQVIRSKDDEMRTLSQQLAGKDNAIRSKEGKIQQLQSSLDSRLQQIQSLQTQLKQPVEVYIQCRCVYICKTIAILLIIYHYRLSFRKRFVSFLFLSSSCCLQSVKSVQKPPSGERTAATPELKQPVVVYTM